MMSPMMKTTRPSLQRVRLLPILPAVAALPSSPFCFSCFCVGWLSYLCHFIFTWCGCVAVLCGGVCVRVCGARPCFRAAAAEMAALGVDIPGGAGAGASPFAPAEEYMYVWDGLDDDDGKPQPFADGNDSEWGEEEDDISICDHPLCVAGGDRHCPRRSSPPPPPPPPPPVYPLMCTP